MYTFYKKPPTNALGCMNVHLLHSNHRLVSTTHASIFRVVRTRVKVKVNFNLDQAMKAQMWSRFIALLFP